MLNRRAFMSIAGASVAVLSMNEGKASGAEVAAGKAQASEAANASNTGVSRYVDLKIGTGGHGHTYPGATVPFGMVQVGPDTYNVGWDHCSGYHRADESLMGFSHTHLSGTGCGDMLDILLMPGVGSARLDPSSLDTPERGYRSRFAKSSEVIVPGYYAVYLRDPEIGVELTATERVGLHRYRFAADAKQPHVLLDMTHAFWQNLSRQDVIAHAMIDTEGRQMITGTRAMNGWAPGRQIYFAAQFSEPWTKFTIYSGNQSATGNSSEGKALKAVAEFGAMDRPLLVKVAISGVSIEKAKENFAREVPSWEFDSVCQRAALLWERELSRIAIDGNDRQKRIFYTALYHCMLAPTIFSDVSGSYRGMDGQQHQLAAGEENFSTYSLWDTYRALHPLFTLLQPERVMQMINGLIRMANESPSGPPVWPLQGKETFCMTGWHSVVVVAEAVAKELPGLRLRDFLEPIRRVAFSGDYRGSQLYRDLGYIPCNRSGGSIGYGLDFAYNDWAMARIFAAAGDAETAAKLRERAYNYRNFFDRETGFMRPRLADGSWALPFSANEVGYSDRWHDYIESNPWQATFAVQHDPEGLAQLMGGRQKLEAKLDAIFTADPTLPANAPVDIAGLIGQYAHGNEPSHHIAYLYNYVGVPHKTQQRVRYLLEKMYDDQPDGLAGNEDCGQMSAWYVMSAMGLYAVDPVSANYVLTSPLLKRARLILASGRQLEIVIESGEGVYIESVTWNGKLLDRLWISHKELMQGGRLAYRLSHRPNPQLGSSVQSLPPSMTPVNT